MKNRTGTGFLAILAAGLCACGAPATVAPLNVQLAAAPPAALDGIGGAIDRVTVDAGAGRVEIVGWHMLTPQTRAPVLHVYAPGASGVVSFETTARPDVVEAVNDEDLANAGFTLVLQAEPGTGISELCISFSDKHYGERFLNANTANAVRCTSKGQ